MSKGPKRMAFGSAIQHIYKRTVDKGVLFYRLEDRLVYYTITAVKARRHRVVMLAMSLMYTHIHRAVRSVDALQLAMFERDVDSTFAKERNREAGRTGPVFDSPYGRSSKRNEKEIRTCLIYIFNNPKEKRLCRRAEEDRWNFLAYYDRKYPFSRRPVLSRERQCLRNALKEVEHESAAGRYLRYSLIHKLLAPLSPDEREVLTDHIIQVYFPFDRETCVSMFDSLEDMLHAPDVVTGSEFDVGEEYESHSDVPYRAMCSIAENYGLLKPGMPLLSLPPERLQKLKQYLMSRTMAPEWQVARFLHLKGEERERGNGGRARFDNQQDTQCPPPKNRGR